MIEIIIVILIIGAVAYIVESIFEGLKQILLILLVIVAIIGTFALQIYLIHRWGLAVIGAYAVIVAVILVICGIYNHFHGE